MLVECPECGKNNNFDSNFKIKCGHCKHQLDDKAFKSRPFKVGYGGTTVVASIAVGAAIGFGGGEWSQKISMQDYKALETCVLAAGHSNTYFYDQQVERCVCAFNKTKGQLPAEPQVDEFVSTFRRSLVQCRS